jgi:hypothetical protein
MVLYLDFNYRVKVGKITRVYWSSTRVVTIDRRPISQ